jgi:hypothetical protein
MLGAARTTAFGRSAAVYGALSALLHTLAGTLSSSILRRRGGSSTFCGGG